MKTPTKSRLAIIWIGCSVVLLLTSGSFLTQDSQPCSEACTECEQKLATLEKQVMSLRYIAQGKVMALKSDEVGNAELRALVAMQAYKFNLKYNPQNSSDVDIYNGLYAALKKFDNRVVNDSPPIESIYNALCARVTRNMTTEEWNNFVGSDLVYEKTCAK